MKTQQKQIIKRVRRNILRVPVVSSKQLNQKKKTKEIDKNTNVFRRTWKNKTIILWDVWIWKKQIIRGTLENNYWQKSEELDLL